MFSYKAKNILCVVPEAWFLPQIKLEGLDKWILLYRLRVLYGSET